jgi:hypothetical protein
MSLIGGEADMTTVANPVHASRVTPRAKIDLNYPPERNSPTLANWDTCSIVLDELHNSGKSLYLPVKNIDTRESCGRLLR